MTERGMRETAMTHICLVVSYAGSVKRWCDEGESPRTAIVISEVQP